MQSIIQIEKAAKTFKDKAFLRMLIFQYKKEVV